MSYNKYNITKEQLLDYIQQGMTQTEMAEVIGCKKSNISHFIEKFDLKELQVRQKKPNYYFNKIDSPIKAYILGFIACDSSINQNTQVEITVEKSDKEILDFIAKELNCNINIDDKIDKKNRRFPRARTTKKIPDILKFVGGRLKQERHLPIVNKQFNRYLLLGAFDGDGCLTWGRRKDKNKIWHKISFTTSLGIATCIQQILIKELNISTIIRPKSKEKCFVLEFANRKDIIKFLDYIYCDDFIVLKRKYLKSKALRLELEENGEGANSNNTVPSLQSKKV